MCCKYKISLMKYFLPLIIFTINLSARAQTLDHPFLDENSAWPMPYLGEVSLFEKYQFDEGGYLLIAERCTTTDSIANILGDFYIDDSSTLNEIKQAMKVREVRTYDNDRNWTYVIYICKSKKSIGHFYELSLKDKYIMPSGKWNFFYLDPDLILKHQSKLKPVHIKNEKFSSLTEARNYYNSVLLNDKVIYTSVPKWTNYEGSFLFVYYCTNEYCPFKEGNIRDSLSAEIRKQFPGEPFELNMLAQTIENTYLSWTYTVFCNKSLSDKFSLFTIYEKYKNFASLELTTYWKEIE